MLKSPLVEKLLSVCEKQIYFDEQRMGDFIKWNHNMIPEMAALVGTFFVPESVKASDVSYTFTNGVVTISGSGVADDNSMWE